MLRGHPIFQAVLTLAACYVLFLGFQRFRSAHMKQKAAFNWKRHVWLGKIALIGMFLGLMGGMAVVRITWHGFFITGWHAYIGLCMAPLIVFGLVSGRQMDQVKKKRSTLPLVHGLCNLLVVVLALVQAFTGAMAFRMFVLGIY